MGEVGANGTACAKQAKLRGRHSESPEGGGEGGEEWEQTRLEVSRSQSLKFCQSFIRSISQIYSSLSIRNMATVANSLHSFHSLLLQLTLHAAEGALLLHSRPDRSVPGRTPSQAPATSRLRRKLCPHCRPPRAATPIHPFVVCPFPALQVSCVPSRVSRPASHS